MFERNEGILDVSEQRHTNKWDNTEIIIGFTHTGNSEKLLIVMFLVFTSSLFGHSSSFWWCSNSDCQRKKLGKGERERERAEIARPRRTRRRRKISIIIYMTMNAYVSNRKYDRFVLVYSQHRRRLSLGEILPLIANRVSQLFFFSFFFFLRWRW